MIWFPEPIGAADCYRAGLADPFLLHQQFGSIERVQSRQAATRRDRLTARLPMLRTPHPEGLEGAVWVEVRGTIDGRIEHRVMGATGRQATGAAHLVATAVAELGNAEEGMFLGVTSAASFTNPGVALRSVSDGLRLWAYDGAAIFDEKPEMAELHAARKWRLPRENRIIPTIF